jgi:glyoxylase-like metal-dependent hydrolase (beta-lactamase superfamily II)
VTAAGDVIAVATPGHTAGHLSVIVLDEGITYVLAGDASYTEALMLAGQIDGVSEDDASALATLRALKQLAAEQPTVYLATHDPESAERLANRRLADVANHQTTVPDRRKERCSAISTSCGRCDGFGRTGLRFSPPLCGRWRSLMAVGRGSLR